jgi:N-acetylneuraminate synthase
MNCYIIAEAGVNHNGSEQRAFEMVTAAKAAGVDAVKFQTFKSELVVTGQASKAHYQQVATGRSESQLEMIKRLELDFAVFKRLKAHCDAVDLDFLSTPFDLESLAYLNQLGLSAIKIPSGELTNAPYLLAVAATALPVIMSTGMSTLGEIEEALGVLAFGYTAPKQGPGRESFRRAYSSADGQAAVRRRVTLMHCTTEYPAPVEEVNLRAIETLRRAFGLPVGYSDHTEGTLVPVAAVCCGAQIIEKHFTLDQGLPGPDHQASLEPMQLAEMVAAVRAVERAIGDGVKRVSLSESKNIAVARRSLVAAEPIPADSPYTSVNLTAKRPGTGISPMRLWDLIGRRAPRDHEKDDIVEAPWS